PVDASGDSAVGATAARVKNLDRQDLGVPGDAGHAGGVVRVRGDDARHHGAVPKVVVGRPARVDEVVAAVGPADQIRMTCVDAGVQYGDRLAAGGLGKIPRLRHPDGGQV